MREQCLLLALYIVKPRVIGEGIAAHLLLVLEALLRRDHLLYPFAIAVLLLKLHVLFVDLRRLRFGQHLQCILVEDACALALLCALLKLRERDEKGLRVVALVELLHRALKDRTRERRLARLLLELCPFHPRAW